MGVRERRAREKENLRQEILDAARLLFVKEGYENVSIRKIADRIDYSPGTIYLYFKDKADIFESLADETFWRLHRRLSAIVADGGDPLERLRRVARSYVEFALENPNHYMVTFVVQCERAGDEPAGPIESGMACFGALRDLVTQAVNAGKLRIADVDEVSQSLWACMHGVATLLISKCGFPFIEQSRLIDRVVDIAIEGIRKQ
jgi:AcrR family transcriptional regulator